MSPSGLDVPYSLLREGPKIELLLLLESVTVPQFQNLGSILLQHDEWQVCVYIYICISPTWTPYKSCLPWATQVEQGNELADMELVDVLFKYNLRHWVLIRWAGADPPVSSTDVSNFWVWIGMFSFFCGISWGLDKANHVITLLKCCPVLCRNCARLL